MFDLENKSPRILVVGDLMIDHYIWGDCNRISPEAPVQVVNVKSESNRFGGSCNVVNNLIALGAKVSVCGVVGEDSDGIWLVETLESLGVGIEHIFIDPSRPTTKKSRVVISNQQVLRVDRESSTPVDSTLLKKVREDLDFLLSGVDCVIISDYDKGLLNYDFTQHIISLARSENKPVLCDPKGVDYSKYRGATLLTPNKKEASLATNIPIVDDESLLQAGSALKKMCELSISLITLSEDGIGIIDKSLTKIPTYAQEVYDVTGAGDTVIAALGFALSSGLDIYKASEFANVAAAVVVGKVGSASATHIEIERYLHSHQNKESNKVFNKEQVKCALDSLKSTNKESKIVFTNGCFDILHRGHIQYLRQARALGDVLIVGLNSDASVSALKGADRPINPQDDRAFLLANLECVDFVVIFDEETPKELIRFLAPDILVKGADYEGKELAGSEYVKEVKLLPFVEGKSSTKIIEKIKGANK
ncbi:D-glycero-beta-D-manno-heptose-7-phosphate kinase [Helicobacter himalayensis]|uniref:D-glycero-beta-D-manno-heptose-7-phosphate kinase n=1 Tax=Helicobacter himalayensis TaxID=1591088 RepID=UPI00082D30D6|nr:D-glycero-beta-D-manno-heptose-7-phosphate kinase [Helicobacter himalayensis]